VGETDQITRPRIQQRPPAAAHCCQEPATIVVAIQASDAIIGAGAAAYLRSRPGIIPVPAARAADADVVLVLAGLVTEDTLSWMQQTAAQAAQVPGAAGAARGTPRFVLVGDGVRVPHLLRAVGCGPVSVLPRQGCDYEQIVQAIQHVHHGRVVMPAVALEPSAAGLQERELDVLRLLADGLGTLEIARRLNYSERTVKNIIHLMLNRMNLRNRPHAVAFALRNGLL
jgi:DNA-binding NarL/FixJ family response regulator